MPRQYRLYFKRGSAPNFGVLEPGVNSGLYDRPQIADAIEQMRVQPHVVGMSLRLGDELFNVIQFEQDALAPKAFEFVEPADEGDTVLATPEDAPLYAGYEYNVNDKPGVEGNCGPSCCAGADVGDITITVKDELKQTARQIVEQVKAELRGEDTPSVTFNGRSLEELREEKGLPPGTTPRAENFAAIYGADPVQQPVDGDTANDGLVN